MPGLVIEGVSRDVAEPGVIAMAHIIVPPARNQGQAVSPASAGSGRLSPSRADSASSYDDGGPTLTCHATGLPGFTAAARSTWTSRQLASAAAA